ncbi:MAG: hypothetical protein EPN82_12755 [Bacteroidetes bacterium]|nr:MAG: hypothetical protein EPN82_12755 [Bacteroidota bacterium]
MIKLIVFFTLCLLFSSCTLFQTLKSKKLNPDCPTNIEGCVHYKLKPNNKDTCMFLNLTLKDKLVKGKFIEKTSEGIIFMPKRPGEYYSHNNLYEFDDVQYVLGANGNLIYGKFPDYIKLEPKINFWLRKIIDTFPEPKAIKFTVIANEPFCFCIDKGKYILTELIIELISQKLVDKVTYTFDVNDSSDNYLGDIYLDSLTEGDNVKFLKFGNFQPISSGKGSRRNREFIIPPGLTFQPWLDDSTHIGYHSIFIKDEFKESPGRKKNLIKTGE